MLAAQLAGEVADGDTVVLDLSDAETARIGVAAAVTTRLRFLAAVDDRHGGSRAFLLDHGLTPAMLDELEALLVEHPG